MRLTPLPKRKTPVHVFGDYLAYLYRCTRSFITDTHANGTSLWNAVESDIQFVLSHPNGWEGPQQTRMRNAAVYGNLVPDTDAGKARIRFVTEGEASLHACVLSGLADDVLSVSFLQVGLNFFTLGNSLIVFLEPVKERLSHRRCGRWNPRYQLLCYKRHGSSCNGRNCPSRLYDIVYLNSIVPLKAYYRYLRWIGIR